MSQQATATAPATSDNILPPDTAVDWLDVLADFLLSCDADDAE